MCERPLLRDYETKRPGGQGGVVVVETKVMKAMDSVERRGRRQVFNQTAEGSIEVNKPP
jgi:hypothetical protein